MFSFNDVMTAVRTSGKKYKEKGGTHCSMQCPAHNGTKLNLKIDLKNGEVKFNCMSRGCSRKEIVEALGLKEEKMQIVERGVSLSDVSKAKRLSVDFLTDCGWRDSKVGNRPVIRISYGEGRGRVRNTLREKKKKYTYDMREEEKSKSIQCYKPKEFTGDTCFIVEGETDVCTLAHHGYNALGVPGANMFGKIHHSDLEGIRKVYIIAEDDPAGQSFGNNVSCRLTRIKFPGEAKIINLGRTEYNDISEIHCNNPESFKKILEREMEYAEESQLFENDDYQVVSDDKTFHVFHNKIVYLEMKTIKGEVVEIPRNILNQKVTVESIHKDIFNDDVMVTLKWGNNNRRAFRADTLLMGQNHGELALYGIFIDSNNKNYMASYFRAAISKIATQKSSRCNGWKGEEFVYGDRILSLKGEEKIEFDAVNYCPQEKGDKKEQLKAINALIDDTQIALKVGAAAISPFLEKIGCDNFTYQSWGDSSRGKSTGSKLGASIYGKPTRLLESWRDASMPGIETTLEEAGGLPVFFEESHKGRKDVVVGITYAFANKKQGARARMHNGDRTRRRSPKMLGVFISTGEWEISSLTADGGAVARLLEQHKIKREEEGYAEKLEKCVAVLEEHHGHLGKSVFHKFFQNKHEIIENFEKYKKELRKSSDSGLQYRQTPYFAACLAGCEILRSLGVDMPKIEELNACCLRTMSHKPKGLFEKAIDHIMGCVDMNRNSFLTRRLIDIATGSGVEKAPRTFDCHIRGQVYGFIDEIDKKVFIYPPVFKRFLEDENMNVQSVKKAFKEKGILIHGRNELTSTKNIYGKKRRVVAFSIENYIPSDEEQGGPPTGDNDNKPTKGEEKPKQTAPVAAPVSAPVAAPVEKEVLGPYFAKGYDYTEKTDSRGKTSRIYYEKEDVEFHREWTYEKSYEYIASVFEKREKELLEESLSIDVWKERQSVVTPEMLKEAKSIEDQKTGEHSLFDENEYSQYDDERGQ